MRGPSGSGKTMFAGMISRQDEGLLSGPFNSLGSPWLVMSPDDYFAAGVPFSPSLIGEANRICLRKFARNIVADVCDDAGRAYNIIVDAPNVTVGDVAPYTRLAAAYGNNVMIVTMSGYGYPDSDMLSMRSSRKTPYGVIERQLEGIQRTWDSMRMFGRCVFVEPSLSWQED